MTTPRPDWLALTTEDAIEPELPICDPHHHFWDRPGFRYMLDELLVDIGGGHNIAETVFVECSAMYRKDGPEAMSPVGETEFVTGLGIPLVTTYKAKGVVPEDNPLCLGGAGLSPKADAELLPLVRRPSRLASSG